MASCGVKGITEKLVMLLKRVLSVDGYLEAAQLL